MQENPQRIFKDSFSSIGPVDKADMLVYIGESFARIFINEASRYVYGFCLRF